MKRNGKSRFWVGALVALSLVCSFWATSAQAIPNYILSGYSASFIIDGSADAYGSFSVVFTGGAANAAGTQVSGLTGKLNFAQDLTGIPTPINGGPGVLDYSLPNNSSTFGGTFTDLFILSYDSNSGYLELSSDLTPSTMLSMKVGTTFDLLAYTAAPIDLTGLIPTGQETITGSIGADVVDFTTDELAYSAPVPEPSTFLLIGGGLAGLAFWRRRKA